MLNYVALWVGVWAFGLGGPLHSDSTRTRRSRSPTPWSPDARLPVFWGDPELQGLHIGIFIAWRRCVVFWVLLNRSVAGYEARAVGFNPDAAEYGGIHAGPDLLEGDARSAAPSRGSPASIDILGWQFAVATNDIQNAGVVGSASSASRSRCSGATPRAACCSRRCCSAR